MAREIPLTRGYVAIVDDEDFDWLNQWKWALGNGYAVRSQRRHPEPQAFILMHRVVLNAPAGVLVDHANRNRLDNRRGNLRLATTAQNAINRPFKNKTGYRGVVLDRGVYRARIKPVGSASLALGVFADAEDAARAYDSAARQHFGEFAVLNFPEAV